MEESKEIKMNRMGTERVPTLLLKTAFPMIFSMIVSALYNIVDSIFIGMMEAPLNEKAITALGYAFPLQMLLVAVAIGTGIGVNAVLSKALGQRKNIEAAGACVNGYLLMIAFYLLFLAFGLAILFGGFYFSAVTTDEMVASMGAKYLGICFIFSFGQLLQLVSERSLCATGKTTLAMVMQLSGAITNIALDPLFILTWNMGVEGAAIATIIGQMVSMVVGFLLMKFANKEIAIRKKDIRFDFSSMKKILHVGFPSIILQAIQSLQPLVFQLVFMSLYHDSGATQDMLVAVYGVYYKLQNFVFMALYGLVNAMLPLVAFNYGSGNEKRAKQAALYGYLYGLVIALIGIIVFEAMPKELLLLFRLNEEWVDTGVTLTRLIAPTFLLASLCVVSNGVLQGYGNGIHPMVITALRLLVILFPASFLFGYLFGMDAIWWGSYLAEGIAVMYALLFTYFVSKKKSAESNQKQSSFAKKNV